MNFLSFGEILYDVFPDKKTLGGAPLNVSAHLAKLGAEGAIVSAIGNDELGEKAIKSIQELNLDTSYIYRSSYATGRADITLVNKSADYTFNSPCAWDDINLTKALPKEVDLLYFGSLAQRSETSQTTLKYVLTNTKAKVVFYDVNIRKHYYTDKILKESILCSTILKMNDEECAIIAKAFNFKDDEVELVASLFKATKLTHILITKGSKGTTLYSRTEVLNQPCSKVKVIDTVGAGDSLSAGFLYTYLTTNDVKKALRVGSHLADFVVAHAGAIPQYTEELKQQIKDEIAR